MEFQLDGYFEGEGFGEDILGKGQEFPYAAWSFGAPSQRGKGGVSFHGGWFIGADQQLAMRLPLDKAGFVDDSLMTREGDEVEGMSTPILNVAVLRLRRRWVVRPEGTERAYYFAWDDFDTAREAGSPRGQIHVATVVKGLEDHGVFVLTMTGTAQQVLQGQGRYRQVGVLPQFKSRVLNTAGIELAKMAKAAGKVAPKLGPAAFWLPIGVDMKATKNKKGEEVLEPEFLEAGTGSKTTKVVVPSLIGVPEQPTREDLAQWQVPFATYNGQFRELYESLAEWEAAWADIEPGATDEAKAAVANAEQVEGELETEVEEELTLAF